MMTLDPLADLFTRIRNGYMAHLDEVEAPYSKMKESVLGVLHSGGFIENFQITERKGRRHFVISLRYEGRTPAITRIERSSTPGRRLYVGASDIPSVLGGMGMAIVSTSSGIMTGKEARSKKVGGELLGRVW
jgi:small subunit ribosomal protein S8